VKTTKGKNRRSTIVIMALVTSLLVLATASTRKDAMARPSAPSASTLAIIPSQTQGKQVEPTQPDATVGSAFTYQGQIKDGGNPANGQYDFTFKLFDASSAGTQVGSTLTMPNQAVSNGVFTVVLDFGATAYQGQARWLEIAVRVVGSPSYTTLSPRQPLNATPYAASLMPGAVITATDSVSPVLFAQNTGFGVALRADSAASDAAFFVSRGSSGIAAVRAYNDGTHGYGVYGQASWGTGAIGVYGASSEGTGVWGETDSATHAGVYGSSPGTGVSGTTTSGYGVSGTSTGVGYGVYGSSTSYWGIKGSGASGIWGVATASNGTGVAGESPVGYGVHGSSTSGWGVRGSGASGIWGVASASSGTGVAGQSPSGYGVTGSTGGGASVSGVSGTSTGANGVGVSGLATNGAVALGVWGSTTGGRGVYGSASTGVGVYGASNSGWAGYFLGNVNVTGNLSKGGGSFKIDHPLDPENKYLYHSFVESPDMMNVYNGNVTTDARGEAVVQLPSYFEALNMDFRYQLTVIGQFAQAIVATKIKDNRFTIKTDKPNVEVSWQVTGIRHDPYANAHRIQVEVDKTADEKGKYLHPTEYGQPESQGIGYEERVQSMPSSPDVKKP
jgi:hypothetical protein